MNAPSPVKTEPTTPADIYALPSFIPPWLGWVVAAVCFFAAIFFAAKSFNVRGQLQLALESERVARLEVGTAKNLLEAERLLSRAQLDRLAEAERLIPELQAQANPHRLKILLFSPASPGPRAVVAWSSDRSLGVFVAAGLPPPPTDHAYQLWHVPSGSAPINMGSVIPSSDDEEARKIFHFDAGLADDSAFTVTLERSDAPASAHPQGLPILTTR